MTRYYVYQRLTQNLQISLNDIDTFSAMIEGLETVSRTIAGYAIFEALYLSEPSRVKDDQEEAITRLYASILVYLGSASQYYGHRTGT